MRIVGLFLAAAATLSLAPAAASAHALHAEAKLDNGKIVVTARFDGDEPAEKAKVFLVNEREEKELRGRTDVAGQLRFDVPQPGNYHIIVDAGAGHVAKVAISITPEMQPGPAAPVEPIRLGEGQTLEEVERSRWWKIAIGLLAILGFALLLKVVTRKQKPMGAV